MVYIVNVLLLQGFFRCLKEDYAYETDSLLKELDNLFSVPPLPGPLLMAINLTRIE